MITAIPLPDYKPDQTVASGVLLVAKNVYPAIDGYRPFRALETTTDALPSAFNGGFSAIANTGDAYLIAGTDEGLYQLASDGSWTTLVDSLTIESRWKFAQFGDYVVAVNVNATREIDLAGGTANAIVGAPTGTSVAIVGQHVVIGQADGEILKVRWSAFADHTGWTNGTDQAGEQPLQTGGAVMAIAGGEYGVILQRERIVRMTQTGDATLPFQFDEVSANFGCANGATVAHAGRTVFFYSDRGFMALEDGQALKPIGSEKVDRTFGDAISRDDLGNIYTAIDPENKLVTWGIPGTPGTMWIYNFELDKWTTAELAFAGLFPGFTASTSLEALAVTYTDLDAMTISLDDARWSGGNPRLYAVSSTGSLGTLTGATLEARLDLGYNEISRGARTRIRGIRPFTDAVDGVSVVVNAKQRLGDNDNLATADNLRVTGFMPVRISGRYVSNSIRIAAGTVWTYIQGLDVRFEVGGSR